MQPGFGALPLKRDFLRQVLRSLQGISATDAAAVRQALTVPPLPNYLDNPDGAIYQRAVAATADDTYMDDRWYALTQTSTITPSQLSNPENGYRHALRLTQSQAVAQRMGRAQIIPGAATSQLRGKAVTFGGRVRMSTTAVVRMAVLAWTGAEDAVTSDVVNNWASSTYTTGNFFASTTLTLIGTSTASLTAATAANFSVSGTVPSGTTNLIVFYWTEAVAAQNVTLDAWGLRLLDAPTLVDHLRKSINEERVECLRYYWRPVAAFNVAHYSASALTVFHSITFPVPMRASPTASISWGSLVNASGSSRVEGATGAEASLVITVAPNTFAGVVTYTSFTADL